MARFSKHASLLLSIAVLGLTSACTRSAESARERHEAANTPSGKVGQAAYKAAQESGKVLKAAGRQLGKAAHEAHAGWKEAAGEAKKDPKQ